MKNLLRCVPAVTAVLCLAGPAPAAPKPPKIPARIQIDVAPGPVAAGEQARVTLRLQPIDGVKINRYPQVKLHVPAQPGLVAEARGQVGNAAPPPPERMNDNYFDAVDPLQLTLQVDGGARTGRHDVEGKLVYFYCVSASGFCAPARVPVKIPIEVR